MAPNTQKSRQRASSILTTRDALAKGASTTRVEPKSTHTIDDSLQPFLQPTFDVATYLNSTLPSLENSGASHSPGGATLSELSAQTQTLLSQLNAHSTRLTTTLTQLTDEILKSGSKLAYEVEVLRGEASSLSDTLLDGLRDDVEHFVPGGLEAELSRRPRRFSECSGPGRKRSSILLTPKSPMTPRTPVVPDAKSMPKPVEPAYIAQLRTLAQVRSQLDAVVQIFGDAMEWTFPPSEVSVASSFLSVSAPEPGSNLHTTEEKGQQVSKQLREKITELLTTGDAVNGIEAATNRVEELKNLALVWKGTAEDKARTKFVASLAQMVEDRHRELLKETSDLALPDHALPDRDQPVPSISETRTLGGYGFINHLQKLRGGT